MKQYNIQCNVGTVKYIVNFHDGVKTHKDGSPFFDVATFKNKVALTQFTNKLKSEGYIL